MLDLTHLAVTASAIVAVLALTAAVLGTLSSSWRRSTVLHELLLCRHAVAAGQFDDAHDAHRRAEHAHRPAMRLDDTDVTLLALGPMSLLEPDPVRPLIARRDPMSVVATAVMPSVLR